MSIRVTLASAKGMRKAIASFVVIDEEGVAHEIASGPYITTLCSYGDSAAVPLKLAKGDITCLECLSTD